MQLGVLVKARAWHITCFSVVSAASVLQLKSCQGRGMALTMLHGGLKSVRRGVEFAIAAQCRQCQHISWSSAMSVAGHLLGTVCIAAGLVCTPPLCAAVPQCTGVEQCNSFSRALVIWRQDHADSGRRGGLTSRRGAQRSWGSPHSMLSLNVAIKPAWDPPTRHQTHCCPQHCIVTWHCIVTCTAGLASAAVLQVSAVLWPKGLKTVPWPPACH